MGGFAKAAGSAMLLVAYPFLSAYLAGLGFAALELVVFAALTLWRGWRAENKLLRRACFLLAAILLAGAYFGNSYFVWLLPSFVYLWLAALFGQTLLCPPSLCERLVRLQFPEFEPGIAEYLRELTWVWTLFFAANVVVCAALPILAGQRAWAIYTGVLVYGLMGLLGLGEVVYRRRRFPQLGIPPFKETFNIMAQHGPKVFKDLGA